ncbi:redoxin domain-containing protein [Paenibacillus dokdonensis]|uniref:redoxin domain-containing protein n=1 Tax=Paenibacillus dokdonensis TaxID=2567944 RepID=UPI003D275908
MFIGLTAIAAFIWILALNHPIESTDETNKIMVGVAAPGFEAIDTSGRKIRISDYKGKTIIMNMWASWCPSCVKEMPLLQSVNQLSDHHVETIYVNVGESKGTVNAFLEEHKLKIPVIIDAVGKITGAYQVSALPATFIIGPSGNISRVITGEISEMDLLLNWIDEAK